MSEVNADSRRFHLWDTLIDTCTRRNPFNVLGDR